MPRLPDSDETYVTTVRGMCRGCRKVVPARVFFRGGAVWQQALCPECRPVPAKIAGDQAWYLDQVMRPMLDRAPLRCAQPPQRGCPHDCGPCTWHATPCQLPVLSVTNACNLRCPICFTHNRADQLFFMSVEEMRQTVDWVVESSGPVDLINVTGGEPSLHPQILDLLACCKRPEIGRITMNSNGIRLAEDPEFCRRLAELGVCVILSFNTFDPAVSRRLHGCDLVSTKLKAIDNLTAAGVRMTLLNVLVRGQNEEALTGLFDLMRGNDQILSLTVQTMTYTGQGGGHFEKAAGAHLPVDEATRIVCERSGGALEFGDFLTKPSAHPLCYLTSYMLKAGSEFLPFARVAPREKLQELMQDSYLLRLDDREAFFKEVMDTLFANGETAKLRVFRKLVEALYPAGRTLTPFERQRVAEAAVRTVYIHAHMDEDTFDCSRAMHCPDLVPASPGRLIPACTYNLFYRMQDPRFFVEEPTAR
jgi:uncharacterized radical SAM superfamily Fe-S cluster-containing enzyme